MASTGSALYRMLATGAAPPADFNRDWHWSRGSRKRTGFLTIGRGGRSWKQPHPCQPLAVSLSPLFRIVETFAEFSGNAI
jgi:hypothetical protein